MAEGGEQLTSAIAREQEADTAPDGSRALPLIDGRTETASASALAPPPKEDHASEHAAHSAKLSLGDGEDSALQVVERGHLRSIAAASVVYLLVFGAAGVYLPPLLGWLVRFASAHRPILLPLVLSVNLLLVSVFVAAAVWLIYEAARVPLDAAHSALLALSFAALWYSLTFHPPARGLVGLPAYGALTTFTLAAASAGLGRVIAAAFKDRNLVAVGAGVGALVDIWGVYFGTTKRILQEHPALHHAVSVALPQAGPGALGPQPSLLIGPGDYIFMGILFALVHRFGLRSARTGVMIWFFVVLSFLLVLLVPHLKIPGVVGMALAVILPNIREFRFTSQEKTAILVGIALLAAAALLWTRTHLH